MSANPLRLAALVQGYPVRPPFDVAAIGNLRLWYDVSDASFTTVAASVFGDSLKDITDKSGNHGQRWIVPPNSASAIIEQQGGKNAAAFVSATSVTFSNVVTNFNFMHQTAANVFAVLKSPAHPLPGPNNSRRLLIGTAYFDYDVGFFLALWDNGTESQASVEACIGRGSSVSRVAKVDKRAIWPSSTWGVVHVATNPTTNTYADRLVITYGGQSYASNVDNHFVADSNSTWDGRIDTTMNAGSLAELLIYDGAISVPASAVMSYLSAKWSI
jgi:hypothetical protein